MSFQCDVVNACPEHWRLWKRGEKAEKKDGKEEGKSIEGEHVAWEPDKCHI